MPNKKFTTNDNINRLVGPPRGNSLDGQAPTYSTIQIRTSIILSNVNTVNESDDNNKVIVSNNVPNTRDNDSWMFETTLLHQLIHKHESVHSTTLLALHRLHPLLLPPMLLLMIKTLQTYGTTI